MFKLYKRLPDGGLAYHEAWAYEGKTFEHWGRVRDEGETRELPMRSGDGRAELTKMLREAGGSDSSRSARRSIGG